MTTSSIPFTVRAVQRVDDLVAHYLARDRPEAVRNLATALADADAQIATRPDAGLPAPRPYLELAARGRLWVKAGRYWIRYSLDPLVITAVFHEAADIPGRL